MNYIFLHAYHNFSLCVFMTAKIALIFLWKLKFPEHNTMRKFIKHTCGEIGIEIGVCNARCLRLDSLCLSNMLFKTRNSCPARSSLGNSGRIRKWFREPSEPTNVHLRPLRPCLRTVAKSTSILSNLTVWSGAFSCKIPVNFHQSNIIISLLKLERSKENQTCRTLHKTVQENSKHAFLYLIGKLEWFLYKLFFSKTEGLLVFHVEMGLQ